MNHQTMDTSRSLRFCMLTTFYPPYHFGGDAIAVQRLARGLVRRGHQVTVVHDLDAYRSLHRGPDPQPLPEPAGLTVHRLESGRGMLSCLLTQQAGWPVLNGPRIRAILKEGNFDVLHFHNISLLGGPGLLALGQGLKLYTAHEHWLVCPTHVLWRHDREVCTGRQCLRCTLHYRRPPQLWRWSGLLERHLGQVDVFIAQSVFSRDKHREFGFPRSMELLPCFLPDPEPEALPAKAELPPQERPYFFFAGRLERIKGLDDVIPLFATYPEAELLIAGTGGQESVWRQLAQQIPGVRFLGRLAPEELRQYYRHALAVLVPSTCYETFGLTVLEAFQQGTPVIARRLGPLPEIVNQAQGGELFDNAAELRDSLRRLQSDPPLRSQLGKAGFKAYQKYWSESAVIPRYLDIIRRAAEARKNPSYPVAPAPEAAA